MTQDGSAIVGAPWKTREATIIAVPARPEAMPECTTTAGIAPHGGAAGFDGSAWPILLPTELAATRGGRHVSFLGCRTRLTIPSRLGPFEPAGAMVVLARCVDDDADIGVNGERPRAAPARRRCRDGPCPNAWSCARRSRRATRSTWLS